MADSMDPGGDSAVPDVAMAPVEKVVNFLRYPVILTLLKTCDTSFHPSSCSPGLQ